MNVRLAPILLAFLGLVLRAFGADAAPALKPYDLVGHYWPAVWISDPGANPTGYGVYHFRKSFDLSAVPGKFVVHVTADNRYRLFVNGVSVATGPQRGDLLHWRYETVDVAPQLRAGRNVLAAVVWNAAGSKPWAQMTLRTGFVVQGDSPAESVVNTNATWRVDRDTAYAPEPIDRAALHTFIVVGDGDRIDGARYPWGWQQPGFDDSAWKPAAKTADAVPYGVSTDADWWLVPRTIPPMEESPERLQSIRRAAGISVSDGFVGGGHPMNVPPHTQATVLFDQSFETNAYPVLTVSGGRGSDVRLVYAEALIDAAGRKGNRNAIEGRRCVGKADLFLPDGGAHRRFSPLWFRTYRYIEMQVRTADEPLTIEDLSGVFTGYPFSRQGRFESNDPSLAKIWNVGWRTARLCADETYFDCPYYEQLQYIGDTRIQALISLYVAGDDRLVRNAIELFDLSRLPEGLTQSRYPSASPQVISTFSLFWIEMVHDYWMLRDDPAFVRTRLMGVRNVLEWFEQRVDPKSGMLGPLPYWGFVDWPDQWPWNEASHMGGQPPGVKEGNSAIVTLQFALTLKHAAELFGAFGDEGLAARYRTEAAALERSTLQRCWDPARNLVADTPGKTEYSQHAQALAVLSGAVTGNIARDLIARAANDPQLVQCTLYFRFYLLRAMKLAGLGDEYLAELQPWRDMLARGLTTFAERPDPTRSDCHAWSASPCYELLATVCGIEPAAPGFKRVRIEPHLGNLTRAEGTVPTPAGEVQAVFVRTGDRLQADLTLPPGIEGEFLWSGKTLPLHPGSQRLTAP